MVQRAKATEKGPAEKPHPPELEEAKRPLFYPTGAFTGKEPKFIEESKTVDGFLEKGNPLYGDCREISDKLVQVMGFKPEDYPELWISDSSAFKGGYENGTNFIFITKGILAALQEFLKKEKGRDVTKDDIAFLLGHELRHYQQFILNGKSERFARAERALFLELDADYTALLSMMRAGYNPRAALDFGEFIEKVAKRDFAHGFPSERRKELTKLFEDPEKVIFNAENPLQELDSKAAEFLSRKCTDEVLRGFLGKAKAAKDSKEAEEHLGGALELRLGINGILQVADTAAELSESHKSPGIRRVLAKACEKACGFANDYLGRWAIPDSTKKEYLGLLKAAIVQDNGKMEELKISGFASSSKNELRDLGGFSYKLGLTERQHKSIDAVVGYSSPIRSKLEVRAGDVLPAVLQKDLEKVRHLAGIDREPSLLVLQVCDLLLERKEGEALDWFAKVIMNEIPACALKDLAIRRFVIRELGENRTREKRIELFRKYIGAVSPDQSRLGGGGKTGPTDLEDMGKMLKQGEFHPAATLIRAYFDLLSDNGRSPLSDKEMVEQAEKYHILCDVSTYARAGGFGFEKMQPLQRLGLISQWDGMHSRWYEYHSKMKYPFTSLGDYTTGLEGNPKSWACGVDRLWLEAFRDSLGGLGAGEALGMFEKKFSEKPETSGPYVAALDALLESKKPGPEDRKRALRLYRGAGATRPYPEVFVADRWATPPDRWNTDIVRGARKHHDALMADYEKNDYFNKYRRTGPSDTWTANITEALKENAGSDKHILEKIAAVAEVLPDKSIYRDLEIRSLLHSYGKSIGFDRAVIPGEVKGLVKTRPRELELLMAAYAGALGFLSSGEETFDTLALSCYTYKLETDNGFVQSIGKQLEYIKNIYPEPSIRRDVLLDIAVNSTRLTPRQLSEINALFSINNRHIVPEEKSGWDALRSGLGFEDFEWRAHGPAALLGQFAKHITEPEGRAEMLNWILFGAVPKKNAKYYPDVLKMAVFQAHLFNKRDVLRHRETNEFAEVHFAEFPKVFPVMPKLSRERIIEELCLGENGLFEYRYDPGHGRDIVKRLDAERAGLRDLISRGLLETASLIKKEVEENREEPYVRSEDILECFIYRNLAELEKRYCKSDELERLYADWTGRLEFYSGPKRAFRDKMSKIGPLEYRPEVREDARSQFQKALGEDREAYLKFRKSAEERLDHAVNRILAEVSKSAESQLDSITKQHRPGERIRETFELLSTLLKCAPPKTEVSYHGDGFLSDNPPTLDIDYGDLKGLHDEMAKQRESLRLVALNIQFLNGMFDELLDISGKKVLAGLDKEEDKIRSLFVSIFLHSTPNERAHIIASMQEHMTKEAGGQLMYSFLDSADFFGRKLAQVMSEEAALPEEFRKLMQAAKHDAERVGSNAVFETVEFYKNSDPDPRSPIRRIKCMDPVMHSASLKQVHRALLEDGSSVIVKFIRPYVARNFERSAKKLLSIIETYNTDFPESMIQPAIVKSIIRTAREEIDLETEADYQNRLGQDLRRRRSEFTVPEILYERKWLIMEEDLGEPISTLDALVGREAAGSVKEMLLEKTREVKRRAAMDFFAQLFRGNILHVDMHTGNLTVYYRGFERDGKLAERLLEMLVDEPERVRLGMIDAGASMEIKDYSPLYFLFAVLLGDRKRAPGFFEKAVNAQRGREAGEGEKPFRGLFRRKFRLAQEERSALEAVVADMSLQRDKKIEKVLEVMKDFKEEIPGDITKMLAGFKKAAPLINQLTDEEIEAEIRKDARIAQGLRLLLMKRAGRHAKVEEAEGGSEVAA